MDRPAARIRSKGDRGLDVCLAIYCLCQSHRHSNGQCLKGRRYISVPYQELGRSMNKSDTTIVAQYFVETIVGRPWTPADYKGRHMKSASILLKMGYDRDTICAALDCLKERAYEQFGYDADKLPIGNLEGLEFLYVWGEPPLIERFTAPPKIPPIYSSDYDLWVRQWGKKAIERGLWDGIYVRTDPVKFDRLEEIVGWDKYQESISAWQTHQLAFQQNKLLCGP